MNSVVPKVWCQTFRQTDSPSINKIKLLDGMSRRPNLTKAPISQWFSDFISQRKNVAEVINSLETRRSSLDSIVSGQLHLQPGRGDLVAVSLVPHVIVVCMQVQEYLNQGHPSRQQHGHQTSSSSPDWAQLYISHLESHLAWVSSGAGVVSFKMCNDAC